MKYTHVCMHIYDWCQSNNLGEKYWIEIDISKKKLINSYINYGWQSFTNGRIYASERACRLIVITWKFNPKTSRTYQLWDMHNKIMIHVHLFIVLVRLFEWDAECGILYAREMWLLLPLLLLLFEWNAKFAPTIENNRQLVTTCHVQWKYTPPGSAATHTQPPHNHFTHSLPISFFSVPTYKYPIDSIDTAQSSHNFLPNEISEGTKHQFTPFLCGISRTVYRFQFICFCVAICRINFVFPVENTFVL